jgi:putative aldouronate transport system substrate-binding protein
MKKKIIHNNRNYYPIRRKRMKIKQVFRCGLIFVLLFAMWGSLWAGGRQGGRSGSTELVWAFMIWTGTPVDLGKVEAAINTHLETKGDLKVKLLPMAIGDYTQKINLMLASPSEQLDIFSFLGAQFPSYLSKGQLVPLDDLLASKGQGVIRVVDSQYLLAGQMDGKQYGVPSLRDEAGGFGFLITKEYVDKYQLDLGSIKRVEDITPILATIKRNEQGFYPMSMNVNFEVTQSISYDALSDNFGVLMFDNPNRIVNLFETPQYRQRIELYRSWYQAGYISPDAAASNESAITLMKAGAACAQFTKNKPGIKTENELSTGRELEYVNLNLDITTTQSVRTLMWGIPQNSRNPEKAMELFNLLFTDPVLINLINYGIEGEHYIKKSDGTIGFPAGINALNAKYNLGGMDWQLGNGYLAYPWEGKPADLAAQMKAFNDNAIASPALGFTFDSSRVLPQVSALTAVADQYRRALETGSADLSLLDEFNAKLKAAGLADVIAEKQRQYDAWRASRR